MLKGVVNVNKGQSGSEHCRLSRLSEAIASGTAFTFVFI